MCRTHGHTLLTPEHVIYFILYIKDYAYFKKTSQIFNVFQREHSSLFYNNFLINIFFILLLFYILNSGGPLSALTCCVNVRLLSAIKKISPLIYSQSWVGSWVYTTQAMMTFTLIF